MDLSRKSLTLARGDRCGKRNKTCKFGVWHNANMTLRTGEYKFDWSKNSTV